MTIPFSDLCLDEFSLRKTKSLVGIALTGQQAFVFAARTWGTLLCPVCAAVATIRIMNFLTRRVRAPGSPSSRVLPHWA